MKYFLATDHAGYRLKEKIKHWLDEYGCQYEDLGAYALNPLDDYPDTIAKAAAKVAENPGSMGIVLGNSGQGEAIVANKFPGVRAVVYYGGPPSIITLSRRHNNANVLSLGAAFLDEETAVAAVRLWLKTDFSNEPRHARRVEKIKKLEAAGPGDRPSVGRKPDNE